LIFPPPAPEEEDEEEEPPPFVGADVRGSDDPRLSDPSDVSVVWAAALADGNAAFPPPDPAVDNPPPAEADDAEASPATTDAAVAPPFIMVIAPITRSEAPKLLEVLRDVGFGVPPIVVVGPMLVTTCPPPPPTPPTDAPREDDRMAFVLPDATAAAVGAPLPPAAAAENPVGVPGRLPDADIDPPPAPEISEDDGFGGSSKVGGGKTGLDGTLPVPDGPPLPTRLLVDPMAAAISCCCLANTSLPLVTYPA